MLTTQSNKVTLIREAMSDSGCLGQEFEVVRNGRVWICQRTSKDGDHFDIIFAKHNPDYRPAPTSPLCQAIGRMVTKFLKA